MHKDDFRMRLTAASYWAWRAMQRYVLDKLPPEFRYDIIFRKDAEGGRERVGSILQADDAVDRIMKADKVPVWIDIMVDRVENKTTVFSLECSDEYESEETKLYYTWSGSAPFGVKCGHFPHEWVTSELRGILPQMKFRLCPTFWNRVADFLFLRWLFCRLDPEVVAARAKKSNQGSVHFFCGQEQNNNAGGARVIKVPAGIVDKKVLLDFYARTFSSPDLLARDWIGLNDCLRDLAKSNFTRIRIEHSDIPLAVGTTDREKYLDILLWASVRHARMLTIVFPQAQLMRLDEELLAYWGRYNQAIRTPVDVVNLILRRISNNKRK